MVPRAMLALLLAASSERGGPSPVRPRLDAENDARATALPLLFAARVPSPAQAARGAARALCVGFPTPPPRAAGACERVRRGRHAVAMAAESRREGGKQSPIRLDRAPDAEVKVGVPVPLAVWDELLRVWMAGSSEAKQGIGRMAARSPLMAQILKSTRYGGYIAHILSTDA